MLTLNELYEGARVKLKPEKIEGTVLDVKDDSFHIKWDDHVDSMYAFEDLPLEHVSLCNRHYVAGQQGLFDIY